MALNLQDKKLIVFEINKIAKVALSAVITNFYGITANKMNELRRISRTYGIYVKVIRNTLINRIIEGTNFECLKGDFPGSILILFSKDHPGVIARLFKFIANNREINITLNIKTVAFEGQIIKELLFDRLATVSDFKEAISFLIFALKEASIGRLIRMLTVLRKQKEK
ncbi:50S ribosomal protein L10 [Sodalis sp. CWE]|uniref:50S ribosomal protein L10 n=1 Tax=Sodalis sp. CWE TaxID=2803816 RepID=UPI001C7CA7F1|nr:50S ribosomal protein L10 [Sodalis sp. CWE]MBX4181111.1 50S ribosomal protein L10 [Sodalis sp. CWE]